MELKLPVSTLIIADQLYQEVCELYPSYDVALDESGAITLFDRDNDNSWTIQVSKDD